MKTHESGVRNAARRVSPRQSLAKTNPLGTLQRSALAALAALSVATGGHTAEPPVIDPVPEGATLIRPADSETLQGHVIATLNDPLTEVVAGSTLGTDRFVGELDLMNTGLDVVEPVRFTFSEPRLGFTVPVAIRVNFSRRYETFEGERFYAQELNDLRVKLIVVTKLPIYADPKAAYQEARAWEARLHRRGYETREPRYGLETRASFFAKAHKHYDHGIGSDYPSFNMVALRQGHVGINIKIQRSPHPERDGPEAHGFNIGIVISDLRVGGP